MFGDDYAITVRDDESDPDEQRFVTLGMGIKGAFWQWSTVIISARTAGRLEREQYEAPR